MSVLMMGSSIDGGIFPGTFGTRQQEHLHPQNQTRSPSEVTTKAIIINLPVIKVQGCFGP